MTSQVSKWGNSQGIRIPKKLLQSAKLNLNDKVVISVEGNTLIIEPEVKKSLSWYLEGYERPLPEESWEKKEPTGREVW
jgi:antitoxin MazE